MDPELARLAAGKYVLVTTFRKDGTPVPTPVWVARDGEKLVFWSARAAGKVKRLRRDGAVELTECDIRGTPRGATVRATAELMGDEDAERVRKVLARKNGLFGRLTFLGSRIRRGADGTVCFSVSSTTG